MCFMPKKAQDSVAEYILLSSDKKIAKCRHKENKHVHAFQTCFLLGFLRGAGSRLPVVLEVVILHKYSMESIRGSLMIVSYKDYKSDCEFLLFFQLGDLISNKQK